MSMHGELSHQAYEAMTDERKTQLRHAAQVIAGVFGESRHSLARQLISGSHSPEVVAALEAMMEGETECAKCLAIDAPMSDDNPMFCRTCIVALPEWAGDSDKFIRLPF